MAKTAPKGKDVAAKASRSKAEKPAAPKAVKATVKPAAVKAAKPSSKAAKAPGKAVATAPKKAPTKSVKGKAGKVSRGDRYSCEVCGLVVSVDEACGCVNACDIICCGQEMQTGK